MTQPPVLALPDFNKPFLIQIDAPGMGIRVLLHQNSHIAYFITKFYTRLLNVSTYVRELRV